MRACVVLQVGNYGTVTTSRIEWAFVTDPSDAAKERLGLAEWPGTERERDHKRDAKSWDDFAPVRSGIDARLMAAGEQALSHAEFYALRLYTGPLFMKYNSCLRALGTKIPVMERRFHELVCCPLPLLAHTARHEYDTKPLAHVRARVCCSR